MYWHLQLDCNDLLCAVSTSGHTSAPFCGVGSREVMLLKFHRDLRTVKGKGEVKVSRSVLSTTPRRHAGGGRMDPSALVGGEWSAAALPPGK
jgi:hypothetical protein